MMTKNKKGLSVIIGYVLLISFAVAMSIIVYAALKTYINQRDIECVDGVSMAIEQSDCRSIGGGLYQLNLTFENNGRFNLKGYYIRARTIMDMDLALHDISGNLSRDDSVGAIVARNAVYMAGPGDNPFPPGEERLHVYNLSSPIYSIEVEPLRMQEHDNRMIPVGCEDSRIIEDIQC